MQIKPVQPVTVKLKCGHSQASCFLIQLTDNEMELRSTDYLAKDSEVNFTSTFFQGEAIISSIEFLHANFSYILTINHIKYQPGLLVNMKL